MTPRPYTLVAELTYKCPLRCGYCSNPIDLEAHAAQLPTESWQRIFTEAEGLGVVALHLTGGEPLLRKDLEALVAHARSLGLYTNLITSGVPLTHERLQGLAKAGLDHVQLSFQDATADSSDRIAGASAFGAKLEAAAWVKDLKLPLTMNVVLHADNIDHAEDLVALAEQLGANRLELANTQYLGWALVNRERLLPTAAQIDRLRTVAKAARDRLVGKMEIIVVLPDYVAGRPRPCMDGWASRFIVIAPDGLVLPCHSAQTIKSLTFESARDRPLAEVWEESPALRQFRGEDWMPEPCRSCDLRGVDFGGCRCQAFELLGDAGKTDPACSLSPDHAIVTAALARAGSGQPRPELVLRGSRRLPVAG
jgi:pyrroloquinoline quinone biosynthesis protein E